MVKEANTVKLNGCHSRPPFRETLRVQDGYFDDSWHTDIRTPRWITIPFRGEKSCQYALSELGQADAGCTDCKHKANQGVLI
ncbi:MAG: hypothetical protein WC829_15370 [Hyphomicrobium sp.]|jgi:hypothetical protein